MGCSASRPDTLLFTKSNNNSPEEDPYSSCCSSSLEYSMVSSSHSPPVPRALSLPTPLVHHPPVKKGDTHHLVSLTSTTYGSLILIDTKTPDINGQDFSDHHQIQSPLHHADPEDSLSPDSVINTWELMDGLDDDDFCDFDLGKPNSFVSSKSNTLISSKGLDQDYRPAKPSLTKPLWKHLSEESLLSKLDPNVVSSYRRALSSRQLGGISSNNECRSTMSVGSSPSYSSLSDSWFRVPSSAENRIVLYFTSLRGIRKTYEDCCSVRMIFRGFRVPVDERDISMDSMYRTELQSLVGGKAISLPQVFIRGKHVGGVEEIKQLNESGELAKLLEGFPIRDPRIVCEGCGDARFVPCPNCNGSKKVFEEDEGRLRRCPDCNENGLIRCPGCCS
ncbi:Glutaredoxin [Corchorus capsularis]|uniref:Glutaredoxin n=1 Tax=Corchorus capsularis TaxID=210143 RepID=A0A1R3K327_COCAP|nr:Glutaredoxin [Corchorus capsularis]